LDAEERSVVVLSMMLVESSTNRTVRAPGAPLKWAAGTNLNSLLATNNRADEALTLGKSPQLPPEDRYCQTPWPEVAALPTIATPASALALEPLVTASAESLKRAENRVLIVAPGIEAVSRSSLMAVRLELPEATGASFTEVTVRLTVSETAE
jgi:hypothetical protein